MLSKGVHITGVKVNYYFICKTKLWLFAHDITMENESDRVSLGRILHDQSYSRREKELNVDDTISFDFISKGDVLEIHEVKLTSRMPQADRWQMLYYLYYLDERGIKAVGVLNYPKEHRVERVELTPEAKEEMASVLEDIEAIVRGPFVMPQRKGICRKCSYFDFCFGGEEDE